jgi:hypothetical protein
VEPDPLGQPTHDQGDLRPADRLPLPVHEAGRGRVGAGLPAVGARALVAGGGRLLGVALLAAALPALAAGATITGTRGPDTLRGGPRADVLRGLQGNDFLDGRGGRDVVEAGAGADRVRAQGGARDTVRCGISRDVVNADLGDAVARDCEVVSRQISRDPYRNPPGQHETEVEPDTFAWDSTIVSTFQAGRNFSGGASNIGFATSRDGGRTWRAGFLPGLTPSSSPPGSWTFASDPVVAYDSAHGVWLISSLLVDGDAGSALGISRSRDGLTWGQPILAETAGTDDLDKQWLACDNGRASPFLGSCYLSYSDFRTLRMSTQHSRDGGLTWSEPVGSADNAGRRSLVGSYAPAPQPVVRPNGDVVIPFWDVGRMAAVRSTDGGVTFSPATVIAPALFAGELNFRAGPFASVEVDAGGTVYAVWPDCTARPRCGENDLVLARSADGVSWTPPQRLPLAALDSRLDLVVPGLAVDPAGTGATTRLALAYYTLAPDGVIDVAFSGSADGGATWSAPQRLNAETMALDWLPDTRLGHMVGDYISTSFVGGNAVPVFAVASRPGARFDQGMFAAVLPVR